MKKIGTHYATNCDGDIVYTSGKGFGYRHCMRCGATPDPMTREEVEKAREQREAAKSKQSPR